MIYRPIVLNKEVEFSKKKFIVSKTDTKGRITFVNKNFCDVSGYTAVELIGVEHNILRHPDMPKAIFYMIWKSLNAGVGVSAVIKNLSKSGRYYWLISDISVEKDSNGNLKTFSSFNRIAPEYVRKAIEELYNEMLLVEKREGVESSLQYLEKFLAHRGMSYDEFLEDLAKPKGVLNILIDSFKKVVN